MKALHILGLSLLMGIFSISAVSANNLPSGCLTGNGNIKTNGSTPVITYKVTSKRGILIYQGPNLQGNVRPGATVEVTFESTGSQPTNFSLAAYTAQSTVFDDITAAKDSLYDYKTITVGAGVHTMSVIVPQSFYEVDFVYGCVLATQGPAGDPTNYYYGQMNNGNKSRLIAQGTGGSHSPTKNICGGPGNLDTCKKVTICHYPPGNPANVQIITISKNAVNTHFTHHNDVYYNGNKCPTRPPGECACDYDGNGQNDLTTGYTGTSVKDDSMVTAFFSATGSSVQITANFTISTITYYTLDDNLLLDTTKHIITNVNSTTYTINATTHSIVEVVVDGNVIQDLAFFDPQFICGAQDCGTGGFFPVTMTDFSGKKIADNTVELKWSTSSEINNAYFVIEKSSDITNWEEVQGCKVAGHGTTQTPQHYSCIDDHAGMGQNIVYYRPKQVDNNGTYEYFNTIKIRLMDAAFPTAIDNVYPNPTTDAVHIKYTADDNGIFNINIMSIDGKNLLHTSYVAQRGSQVIDLNLPETALKSGFYILEVQNDAQVYRQKIYKQ